MKKLSFYIFLFLLGTFLSCQSSKSDAKGLRLDTGNTVDITKVAEGFLEDEIEVEAPVERIYNPFFTIEKLLEELENENNYYILNYASLDTEEEAVKMIDSLSKDYPTAGYLWAPDFANFAGEEAYIVFLQGTTNRPWALNELKSIRVKHPETKCSKLNLYGEKWVAYSPTDIAIDDQRLITEGKKYILTYAAIDEMDEYTEGGGEDWGYFVDAVEKYFSKKYPAVKFGDYSDNDWLTPEKIEELKGRLNLKGFGYVVINGEDSDFIRHNMSDEVIRQARKFFRFIK